MDRALGELRADGPSVTTTAAFLSDLLDHPRFRAVEHDTAMVTTLTTAEKPAN
jgi:acetyl-CoA carboxylase biotin carboxylase subunit